VPDSGAIHRAARTNFRTKRGRARASANGEYAFRNLEAGEHTVAARHDGREYAVAVRVPDGPALVKGVDVASRVRVNCSRNTVSYVR
jgi:hypothetical protein